MYCNMCGKNNDAGYQFCGYCGAPLSGGAGQNSYSQPGMNLNGQAYPQQNISMQPQAFVPYSKADLKRMKKEQRRRERELMRMPDPLREKYKSQYNTAKIIAIIVVVIMVALAIFFYAENYEERERVKEIMGSDYYYYNW